MNKLIIVLGFLFIFSFSLYAEETPLRRTQTVVSQEFVVDKRIPSMTGPWEVQEFSFGKEKVERIWLTGLDMKAIRVDENMEIPNDYLCHANLNFGTAQSPEDYVRPQYSETSQSVENPHRFHLDGQIKKISLSMGYTHVQFPKSFGVPLYSARPLSFDVMMLNQKEEEKPFPLKFKTTFTYVQDKDVLKPMKALADRRLKMVVPVRLSEEGDKNLPFPVSKDDVEYQANNTDIHSYHWYVPPGRHKYRQKIGEGVQIPFDTTIHHVTAHMHPYAKSMELFDLTEKKSVFKAKVRGHSDHPGIAVIAQYSSQKGVPVYQDHQYELITIYKNTTSYPIDAMAIMYVYFWDKQFQWAPQLN